jgi:hypothetical protein
MHIQFAALKTTHAGNICTQEKEDTQAVKSTPRIYQGKRSTLVPSTGSYSNIRKQEIQQRGLLPEQA